MSERTHEATVDSAIRECKSHLSWIERDRTLLADRFPLDGEQCRKADERTIELTDQLIYRFTKFQNSMARRLLPSYYSIIESSDEPIPFLDMLNRLEQLGLLTSAGDWQLFRTLNELYDQWPKLRRMYERIRDDYRRRDLSR